MRLLQRIAGRYHKCRDRSGSLLIVLFSLTILARPAFSQTCDQTAFFPRPIPLGVSGSNSRYFVKESGKRVCLGGTLGSLVEDSFGRQYILSNNHVFARVNKPQPNALIVQPGINYNDCRAGPNNVVASLTKFKKLNLNPGGTNVIDVAIAKVREGDVSPQILNIGDISNTVVANPSLGLPVQKMGAASCLTSGTISAVNVNVKVNYVGKQSANFVNQFAVTAPASQPFNTPGDSGSLVVTNPIDGSCPQPVGLMFAQNTVGSNNISFQNPIVPVLSALNVEFVSACAPPGPIDPNLTDGVDAEQADVSAVAAATIVRDAHITDLAQIPGAVGNGIGLGNEPGRPHIVVYVTKLNDEVRSAAPTDVEGVPIDLIETGAIEAY